MNMNGIRKRILSWILITAMIMTSFGTGLAFAEGEMDGSGNDDSGISAGNLDNGSASGDGDNGSDDGMNTGDGNEGSGGDGEETAGGSDSDDNGGNGGSLIDKAFDEIKDASDTGENNGIDSNSEEQDEPEGDEEEDEISAISEGSHFHDIEDLDLPEAAEDLDHPEEFEQPLTSISGSIGTTGEVTSYYLDDSFTSSGFTVNGEVYLCLNGNTLTTTGTIVVSKGSTLYVYDCSEDEEGMIKRSNGGNVIESNLSADTKLVWCGGTLYASSAAASNGSIDVYGGTIRADGACTLYSNQASGTMNIYGGTFKNSPGTSGDTNGVIRIQNAKLNIYGGNFYSGDNTGIIAPVGSSAVMNVKIEGGEFYGNGKKPIVNAATTASSKITISGGVFGLKEGSTASSGVAAVYFSNQNTTSEISGGDYSGYDIGIKNNGTMNATEACTFHNRVGIMNEKNLSLTEATYSGSETGIVNNGTMTVSDGTYSGSETGIENNGTLTVSGECMFENSTGIVNNQELILSGSVTIISEYTAIENSETGTINLSKGSITITEPGDDIYFIKNNAGTIIKNHSLYYSDEFYSEQVMEDESGSLLLSEDYETLYFSQPVHRCRAGEGHVQNLDFENELTPSTTALNNGNYYLSEDIVRSGNNNITVTGNVNLCLNGHTFNLDTGRIVLAEGSSLTVYDCSEDETGLITSKATSYTINLNSGNGVSFTLNGGTVANTHEKIVATHTVIVDHVKTVTTTTTINGVVTVSDPVVSETTEANSDKTTYSTTEGRVIYAKDKSASITINGGTVKTTGSGDAILVENSSNYIDDGIHLTINGGTVQCESFNNAAIALKSKDAAFVMNGGTVEGKGTQAIYMRLSSGRISGGYICHSGSNSNTCVTLDQDVQLRMTGGTIEQKSDVTNAYAVAVSSSGSCFRFENGRVVSEVDGILNTSSNQVSIEMRGGDVSAQRYGVNMSTGNTSKGNFEMKGGSITSVSDGIMFASKCTAYVEMTGGDVTSNRYAVNMSTGNDYKGTFIMRDGTLVSTSNNAIHMSYNKDEVIIEGGSITSEAPVEDGKYAISQGNNAKVVISGGTFTSNYGAVYCNSSTGGIMSISGGEFNGGNYGIYVYNQAPALSGGVYNVTSDNGYPIYGRSVTLSAMLDNSDDTEYEYYKNRNRSQKVIYTPDSTKNISAAAAKTVYVLPLRVIDDSDADPNAEVSIKLYTHESGDTPLQARVTLAGDKNTIPAVAKIGEGSSVEQYQIAYFTVGDDDTKFYPFNDEQYVYMTSDDGQINAYAVDTVELYEGMAGVTVANLPRVIFVNTVDTFVPACDTDDENYGLSPKTAFTSFWDAGKSINEIYGPGKEKSYSQMKQDKYGVILTGGNTYYLSDFETGMSQPTGERVANASPDRRNTYTYDLHYQSPFIYMGSNWLDITSNSTIQFNASQNDYQEPYYKSTNTIYAQNNRTMMYNDLMLDYVDVEGRTDLFANGYKFIATENVTAGKKETGGSIRGGGIYKGYPYITVNGGTVANSDSEDRGVNESYREPEGPKAEITILSGKWGRITGGSRSLDSGASYTSKVIVGGNADVSTIAGAAVEGSYNGNSEVEVTGNAHVIYLMGSVLSWPLPTNEQNIRRGNSTVTVNGSGVHVEELYGGTMGRYSTWTYQDGDTVINVKKGQVDTLWGGSAAGQTKGDITINISGGNVGNLYGAGSSKSPFIEDEYSGGSSAIDGGVKNYGDKTYNGYNIIKYNADMHGVTNLGNTYGTVKVNVSGGTVGTLYGGGMGWDYDNDAYYNDGDDTNDVKNVSGFYNIAQVCNCENAMNIAADGTVTYNSECDNCGSGTDSISMDNLDCDDCSNKKITSAVQVTISGGTVNGNVYAGGKGFATSNRIAKICSGTQLKITGGTVKGNVYGAGENAFTSGNTNVVISSGTFGDGAGNGGSIFAGGQQGDVSGSSTVSISNVTIPNNIYGGSENGSVGGNSSVLVGGSSTVGDIFGGSKNGTTSGKSSIIIEGHSNSIGDIYGGGEGATSKVMNGAEVTINGSCVTGDIYGGGMLGTVTGGTKVTVTDAQIRKAQNGTGGNVYGGGKGESAVVTGDSSVRISGQSIIEGNVYGGGNQGELTGSSHVNISGATAVQGDVFAGGNYGDVDGTCHLFIDGSDGATFNNLYSAGSCGDTGNVYSTIKNIDSSQLAGSIYSCGFGTDDYDANINGNIDFNLKNVELTGDNQYVYIGGTGNGVVEKDVYVTTEDSNVTYKNVYGYGGSSTVDYAEIILTPGSTSSFNGAEIIHGSGGTFNLSDGMYRYTESSGDVVVYRAVVEWKTPELKVNENADESIYVWDAEQTRYVKASSASHDGINDSTGGDVEITVTNKSNASIFYKIDENDLNGFTLSHMVNGNAVNSNTTMVPNTKIQMNQADLLSGDESGNAAVVSSDFKDTVAITAMPRIDAAASDVAVAKYVVTISKDAITAP